MGLPVGERHFCCIFLHKKSVFRRDACSRDAVSSLSRLCECAASEDDQSAERKNERSDAEGVWRSEEAGIKETDVNKDHEEWR